MPDVSPERTNACDLDDLSTTTLVGPIPALMHLVELSPNCAHPLIDYEMIPGNLIQVVNGHGQSRRGETPSGAF